MQLSEIHIANYRNLEKVELQFHPQFNIISGNNGMGKTNLLDAIYYLALTKSYFTNEYRNYIRFDADFLRLHGKFLEKKNKIEVVCKINPKKQKIFEKDGVEYEKLSDHIGEVPIVMIAPKDQDLIYDGSQARRAFLDNTLSQLDHQYLIHLMKYNYHLKQRNAYLKALESPSHLDQALLKIYNEKLIHFATYIISKRTELIDVIEHHFNQAYSAISDGQEVTKIRYKTKLVDQDYGELLKQSQIKDLVLKRTTVGPHRDDLIFEIDDKSLRNIASQGQQKSFILSLKIAQYDVLSQEMDIKPIVLLDDIFDKLDQTRVRHLLEMLESREFGQIFITDTEKHRLENILEESGISAGYFYVDNGEINRQNIEHEETQ